MEGKGRREGELEVQEGEGERLGDLVRGEAADRGDVRLERVEHGVVDGGDVGVQHREGQAFQRQHRAQQLPAAPHRHHRHPRPLRALHPHLHARRLRLRLPHHPHPHRRRCKVLPLHVARCRQNRTLQARLTFHFLNFITPINSA